MKTNKKIRYVGNILEHGNPQRNVIISDSLLPREHYYFLFLKRLTPSTNFIPYSVLFILCPKVYLTRKCNIKLMTEYAKYVSISI